MKTHHGILLHTLAGLAFFATALGCSSENTTPPADSGVTPDNPTPTDNPTPGDTNVTDTGNTDAPAPPPPPSGVAVTQFGYDIQRSGANRNERTLTVSAVQAGMLSRDDAFNPTLDGQLYSQPLYMPRLTVGGAAHDVLFVATQANTMYALDALSGAELWHTALGTPVVGPGGSGRPQQCGNIGPTIGVVGTPVIDTASNTLYAVAFTAGSPPVFRINALDLTTGMQRAGFPADIAPPVTNGSTFDSRVTGQRGALTIANGRVWVPFGGLYGDCGIYHGWVVGIDPANPATQTAFATPGRGSGLWAPAGPTMDAQGHMFVATGNSTPLGGFTAGSLGEFVLRVNPAATGPTVPMDNDNTFSPSDARALDLADADIGSNSPVVIPDIGSTHLLFQAGKAGTGYLLNRDALGGVGTGVFSSRIFSGGVYGATASWTNGTDTFVFVPGNGTRSGCSSGSGGVMALRVTANNYATAWCSNSVATPNPPVISSNGNTDGILWVTGARAPFTLRAINIADGSEIWTSGDNGPRSVRQWVPPVVADGRVWVTGSNTVTLFRIR